MTTNRRPVQKRLHQLKHDPPVTKCYARRAWTLREPRVEVSCHLSLCMIALDESPAGTTNVLYAQRDAHKSKHDLPVARRRRYAERAWILSDQRIGVDREVDRRRRCR